MAEPTRSDVWANRAFAELYTSPTSKALLDLVRGELGDLEGREDLLQLFDAAVVDAWLSGFASARLETLRGDDRAQPAPASWWARLKTRVLRRQDG